ncbi:MAG: 50S ribosomal protein L25 [Planctomycetota bacterium]|jgi:large subunit ribosomal protein L25
MDKKLVLKGEIREHTGSRHAAKVRARGRIPAIVYGHKQEPVAISLDTHNLVEGLHHGHRVVDVEIGKKKETLMLKDLQYDHLGKNIIHIDLVRVDATETVKVTIPIELKGTAKGTHESGIIEEHTDHLEIECKVSDIPESIVVSVKEVDVGDSVHASDIELPAGLKLLSSPSTLLVTCSLVAAAKSTEQLEEEEPAAPEVIGEAKEGEEEPSEGEDKQGKM